MEYPKMGINEMHRSDTYSTTFFGKVMMFFGLAIMASLFGVWVSFSYLIEFFVATPGLMWLVFIGEIALILTSGLWSKKEPMNFFVFALFAVLTGISITPLLLYVALTGGIGIIIKALLATFLTFTAAGLIGWKSEKSLASWGGFLFVSLLGLVLVQIVGIFIPWGSTFEMVYSSIGVIVFGAYTIYDFNRLKTFPEDQYVQAAMHIYLDIFNLFIFILRLMSNNK
ncbi:Bax inhibitor-1/YccA family protein [Patescibacteria group bacterium]|nr:Bax inhibitor-1/YccA family protein [Patescibacteria group bacterium]